MICSVAACSDEPLLLAGLHALEGAYDSTHVTFWSSATTSLVESVRQKRPDVLLLDCSSDFDVELMKALQTAAPACAIVLWVRDIPTETAWQAIDQGVRGILSKTASAANVLDCVLRVAAGELWLERSLSTALLTLKTVRLTRRESQMVLLLSHGMKNKEIAAELGIGEPTVKVYISRLFESGAKDRLELALYGLRNRVRLTKSAGPLNPVVAEMRPIALRPSL